MGLYMDRLDRLVEMGIYLDPQDAIRDSLRRTFRAYGLEPFTDKERARDPKESKISLEMRSVEKKVPEDVAPS